jgi:arylsulfatase A-like enzyme
MGPTVWDEMTKIQIEENPGYHFMTDMTDQAVAWVQSEKSLTPDKPFFIYFAPAATHAPHHVPKKWIAKSKGQFDQGEPEFLRRGGFQGGPLAKRSGTLGAVGVHPNCRSISAR